ncbi:sodium/glucose cotransporter 4-like isoform X2 [Haliotis cracherodii]|uniref:sodium/glucose cotransporter 4-like isoform X2 n=1 Tax=Haliotis cracherodii TaxID=6455 RepID=UPI0039EBFD57
MHWIPVGASLFASNIGSGHFVGLAGSGAASGIGIAAFELNAIFILMILGWIFVPVYIAAGADLYSGAIFLTQAVPEINLYLAIIIFLLVTAILSIGGGLTAVIWTDFIQTLIMIGGSIVLMVMSFMQFDSYEEVVNKFFAAWPNTTKVHYGMPNDSYSYTKCGIPPANSMHLIRSPEDPGLPWPGIMFGLTISSIWYWCSDQVIVQRALAAKNISNAKAGAILAGYLKFLPMFLIVFPGMISRILFPDTVACADPDECFKVCGSRAGCTNIAYPTLVLELMPPGLRGLMLAVMMSALISSLTSIFNSSSTLFTMDIWTRFRTKASDVELMIVGRVCILILVGVSIAWIPIVQNISELFHYIQGITSFLAPPVCAIYLLAVFWKRTNEPGAFWGLMVGLVTGLIRFAWEYSYAATPCGETSDNPMPDILSKVHYLHFGCILFLIVTIVTIIISLLTESIDDIHLVRLTFWNRHEAWPRVVIDEEQVAQEEKEKVDHASPPWYMKAAQWICGIEKMNQQQELTPEQKRVLEAKHTSIHEGRTWRIVLNVNAVLLMTCAMFMWGFYA